MTRPRKGADPTRGTTIVLVCAALEHEVGSGPGWGDKLYLEARAIVGCYPWHPTRFGTVRCCVFLEHGMQFVVGGAAADVWRAIVQCVRDRTNLEFDEGVLHEGDEPSP